MTNPEEPPEGIDQDTWSKMVETAAENLYGYKAGWIDENDIAHILRQGLKALNTKN